MFKTYEKFEDFVEALKTRDKNTEIYLKIIPHRDEKSNILSAEILMQFYDTKERLCHTQHYTDGLKAIKVLPSGVFNVISDDKARAFEEERYNGLLMEFENIINEEYKKAKDLFNTLGYKNIKDCRITSG